jgi:hypothetical protein
MSIQIKQNLPVYNEKLANLSSDNLSAITTVSISVRKSDEDGPYPYTCSAVLDLVALPEEWKAVLGIEQPQILVTNSKGTRTLSNATFTFHDDSKMIFIKARSFV